MCILLCDVLLCVVVRVMGISLCDVMCVVWCGVCVVVCVMDMSLCDVLLCGVVCYGYVIV